MTIEVTAVVPTHNRCGLLPLTLCSILRQRQVELEVVVVDDGSTDDTAAVVASFRDPRLRLARHDSPEGVAAARNRGIAEAGGRWLAFCDDDDLWAPDKLACQLEAARTTGRSWVYVGAVKIDLAQRVVGGAPPAPPEAIMARLPGWTLVPGGCSGVLAEREAVQDAGGFDRRLTNLADWDLWNRLASASPPAWVPRPLVAYRIHNSNSSSNLDLILNELELLDRRLCGAVDRGAFHHYLAWVCLRSGRRQEARHHFMRAAAQGAAGPVARDLCLILRNRIRQRFGVGPNTHEQHGQWRAEAERWLVELEIDR